MYSSGGDPEEAGGDPEEVGGDPEEVGVEEPGGAKNIQGHSSVHSSVEFTYWMHNYTNYT